MSVLTQATCRRLAKLPQIPSVWEVDRRCLRKGMANQELEAEADGDCILWVDGTQGYVRAMDMVSPAVGHEAVVRTLLRAIEYPHDPATPARPKKVLVSDRELQFYLRSILQELEIALEYVPTLPLVEEIFRGLDQMNQNRPPMIPPEYADLLQKKAMQVWHLAPWEHLEDHEIIAIELNHWDLETVYLSVMGMLGMEYGVLIYRSIDSLRAFRARVIQANESMEAMQEAFLAQDCLFLTYEDAEEDLGVKPLMRLLPPAIPVMRPTFGNLHPLEGMRGFLYEEEAVVMIAILDALSRFTKAHGHKFQDDFPAISSRYKIPLIDSGETRSFKVSTQPELAAELDALSGEEEEVDDFPVIRDDLVPEKSFLSLGVIAWDVLSVIRSSVPHYPMAKAKATGDGLPVVVIQSTQPKAKAMIKAIAAMGGLKGIGFVWASNMTLACCKLKTTIYTYLANIWRTIQPIKWPAKNGISAAKKRKIAVV
jgi:hypothetical protein